MGLSRCPPEAWLWPDDQRDAELDERARLLAERHDEVFGARPGTEAAGAEVLALVTGWLAAQRPDLAVPPARDDVHPLEAAGRLVQEDLCLMVERDGAPHLDAGCLCFPSHWRLRDKLGRPAREVHGPVPRYDEELAVKVDRYLTRLRPDVIGLRRNWSVHDSPVLCSPRRPAPDPTLTVDEVPDRLWLRSERQTLRRLPATGAVLFTIRVQQTPFSSLRERPDVVAAFAARIRAQPDELVRMNGLIVYREAVLAWLDGAAATQRDDDVADQRPAFGFLPWLAFLRRALILRLFVFFDMAGPR